MNLTNNFMYIGRKTFFKISLLLPPRSAFFMFDSVSRKTTLVYFTEAPCSENFFAQVHFSFKVHLFSTIYHLLLLWCRVIWQQRRLEIFSRSIWFICMLIFKNSLKKYLGQSIQEWTK